MITSVRKRSGEIKEFKDIKIARAIFKAAMACGGTDFDLARELTDQVKEVLEKKYDSPIEIEKIQDTIEKVLIENGHAQTAKKFILYRQQRSEARQKDSLVGATINLMNNYLNESDWQIKENANGSDRSVMALYNYTREEFVKLYWLNEIYPVEVSNAHESGDLHIHDLGFLAPYCSGWDLYQLIVNGFRGSRQSSCPASHFSTILGQLANSIFATQQENAGAQAFSSFDTYLAPFIRYDKLTYAEVRRHLRSFIFEINMPMRIGGQAPFSNLTFDLTCPANLKDTPVTIGGKVMDTNYGNFQAEMDILNKAFVDCMMDGDADNRFFTFPVVTLNVDEKFPWDTDVADKWMDLTVKFGAPYFANFINSDLSPEDARSMCCRLRLDNRELRKRGGGLFGSNPLTGSIGVVTLNMPRIGYKARTREQFFKILKSNMEIARESLELKRKNLERWTEEGLYPYCSEYLKGNYDATGKYWMNHFSTIGLVGMNEAVENFMGKDIGSDKGLKMANDIMDFMREEISRFQEETGNLYNLEATPAESTAYRLALKDRKLYPDIITQGSVETPYYTNSSQLPSKYTDDIFEVMDLQDELQTKYTGGTVQHLYTGDKVTDPKVVGNLIKSIFSQYNMPYISYTPTFSHCPDHGYIKGEYWECPDCGKTTDVYSRVTGYYRPIQRFNDGKTQEFKDRTKFSMERITI
ncbi:ribonucleoside-triphosphate reductase class III catalytic subunit [Dethiosulfatibacter aminovorans DSM 17477]|uniref:Ribonucleoside-triphosphate reductase class III catalytic subunit n=1 Tax=Dethiosulfatibacter aminovorans DSM 17477 TaxID=1121476 RepID=A0A1M6C7B3_9FIRM|nr:ribonucleoside triphosphate reductase [Dethiosulfatibacter aminovorans]SHI56833.1 ribonucleoside-triphosphate reductase class III catalytic subunit [Dethiosulfatibacter aminovorans DSM 17477]